MSEYEILTQNPIQYDLDQTCDNFRPHILKTEKILIQAHVNQYREQNPGDYSGENSGPYEHSEFLDHHRLVQGSAMEDVQFVCYKCKSHTKEP